MVGASGWHRPTHWLRIIRIGLALPCEFRVVKVLQHCIVRLHSIETLSDHKMLLRLIHLDHFDPETACSLLSIGFASAQLKQSIDDTLDGPMTSRFFHRLQGLRKNYYWPQDRSPRSRDIPTDRFWCSFSTCVDVQTCVYKMRQYPTYVHTSKLMYMIMWPTLNQCHTFCIVLPCLAMSCHVWFNWWLPVVGHWRVRTPTWLDFGQWRSRELELSSSRSGAFRCWGRC